jgi:hypothetical protein
MKTMGSNNYVAPFYLPPAVKAPYAGGIKLGQIVLYKDASWTSESWTIDSNSSQHPEGYAFSFSGTPLNDAATWIAFWLPAGTVCTLFDNVASRLKPEKPVDSKDKEDDEDEEGSKDAENPYNFAAAGVCVDLIGNGQIQTVDLVAYGANDVLSGGIWRQVTLSQGWFQLFQDVDCAGPFNTIFLDEWTTKNPHSLSGWAVKFSSINYPCLTPPQILTLSTAATSGQQISLGAANPFGTFAKKATRNFTDDGMNDAVQWFAYNFRQPVKAAIQSVTSNYTVPIPEGQTIEEAISGINDTSEPVQIDLLVAQSQSYNVTAETTLEYSMSATVSTTVTVSEGQPEGGTGTSGSVTTSFTVAGSNSTSRTTSETETIQLGQAVTFTAPAHSEYSATARVSFATLPPVTVNTTGQFYYQQKLPGAVQDPLSKLWMLDGPIAVVLSGAVGTQASIESSEIPIVPG